MGNPRKPSHLKAVQGTTQKCRENPSEPAVSGVMPSPPSHLSDQEADKFRSLTVYIEGMGIASVEDTDALANLASVLVEIEEDQVLLHSIGSPYYVPSKESGIIRSHPAVARVATNRQRAQALLGEFGLTPAARSKVSAGKPADVNPFAALG